MNTSWPVLKLGDISQSIDYGLTASADFDIKSNRFLRITDLKDGAVDWNDVPGCHCETKELTKYRLAPGDIVFARTGATTGKSYLVSDVYSDAVFASYLIRVKPDPKRIDSCYLAHYFQTPFYWQQIRQNSTGSAQAGVNATKLGALDVAVPPLAEQKRIAAILDKADALRQKRKQSLKLLDEFIRSVFLDMFGDPIGNPMGWNKMKLGELCLIRRGASPRPIKNFVGGTVPWIKIGDATKGGDIYIEKTAEAITEEGAKRSVLLEEGSLVFPNCGVSLGFARILKLRGCIHDGWLSLEKIDERLDKLYLLKLINGVTKYLREAAPDGTQPNLNTMIMKGFEIPVPPKDMQKKFSEIVHRWQGTKSKLMRSSEQLDNQFNSLVQRAFRGEL